MALFAAATTVTVWNGLRASFWHSSWLDGRPPAKLYPLLYRHSRRKNRSVRDALTRQNWVRDVAYNLNHDLLSEYFKLWTAIDEVGFDHDETGDDFGHLTAREYTLQSQLM